MKYSYDNSSSVKNYNKKIRKGFKRFHSMNAQEKMFELEDNGTVRFKIMQFVSYDTEIMQIVYDYKHNWYNVYCNDSVFDWSCSTSRQLSRWLREQQDIPFDFEFLRNVYSRCYPVTPDLSVLRFGIVEYNFYSNYSAFIKNWR